MKKENEITVLVKCDYETLKKELEKNGFQIKEEYELKDDYMINKDIDLSNLPTLEILKKCILVRNVVDKDKVLVYKYKKFAPNGDIIEQGKVQCPITDIEKGIEFMEAINYEKLIYIYDKNIVFANDEAELTVQLVNDKYIFIEMEAEGNYEDENYETIDDLKNKIQKFNLPVDYSNYFVKKAEIVLNEKLKR